MSHVVSQMDLYPSKGGTELLKSINVLQAIYWVSAAWNEVLDSTIEKCFVKSGYVWSDKDVADVADVADVGDIEDDVPLKVLSLAKEMFDCEFSELAELDQNFQTCERVVDWNRPAADILSDIACESSYVPSDAISDAISDASDARHGDDDDEDEALYASSVISVSQVHDCISKLQEYAAFHGHSELLCTIINLSDQVSDIRAKSCTKQTTIANFFKKL